MVLSEWGWGGIRSDLHPACELVLALIAGGSRKAQALVLEMIRIIMRVHRQVRSNPNAV